MTRSWNIFVVVVVANFTIKCRKRIIRRINIFYAQIVVVVSSAKHDAVGATTSDLDSFDKRNNNFVFEQNNNKNTTILTRCIRLVFTRKNRQKVHSTSAKLYERVIIQVNTFVKTHHKNQHCLFFQLPTVLWLLY